MFDNELLKAAICGDLDALRHLVSSDYPPSTQMTRDQGYKLTRACLDLDSAVPSLGTQALKKLKEAGFPVRSMAHYGIDFVFRYTRAARAADKLSWRGTSASLVRLAYVQEVLPLYAPDAVYGVLRFFLENLSDKDGFPKVSRIEVSDLRDVPPDLRKALLRLRTM